MIKKITSLPQREIIKGFKGRFVHAENFTVAFWEIEKDSVLPQHSHKHEQTTQVIEGILEMTVGNNTQILEAGMIAVIPSNVVHSGKAITNCVVTDIFSPIREDYI